MEIPLDSRPEESAALGRLVGHWGCVEHGLQCLLGYLLEVDHKKATLIYQSFAGVEAKIALLRRLNNQLPANEINREQTEKLLTNALELNAERNKWVHSLWAEDCNGSLHKLVAFLPRNPNKPDHGILPIAATDMDMVSHKMSKLSSALTDLRIEIQASNSKPLRKET
jgi:hypothetical protein